jgi:hypothetical protein
MNKKLPFCFSLLAAALFFCEPAPATAASISATGGASNSTQFGTITGFVRDRQGRPLVGAAVRLLRDGATAIVKETISTAEGTFALRAAPGRYVLQAALAGFDEVQFAAVNVSASDEIVYRFNLQRAGEGRTFAEQRPDRDDPKFRVRAAQSRRSIFQIDGAAGDETVALAHDAAQRVEAENSSTYSTSVATGEQVLTAGLAGESETRTRAKLDGAVQTYYAASAGANGASHFGLNFALAQSLSDRLRLIISGQTGTAGAPESLNLGLLARLNATHLIRTRVGAARTAMRPHAVAAAINRENDLSQISLQAVDEWVVRDGIVVVVGFDYARFTGANREHAVTPRLGLQFDANAKTRVRAAYARGAARETAGTARVEFEDADVLFDSPTTENGLVANEEGETLIERTRRFEFGVERTLDERSRVEATAFFDTTDDRGVGLQRFASGGFRGATGADFSFVAEQEGAARGVRVVYARRLNSRASLSAGYSFGRGQSLSSDALTNLDDLAPQEIFRNAYFHTGAAQVDADFETGTQVQAVVRFSSQATVFAVDPFAGQLAVYDPSLSILVTQELPRFGLPVRFKALVDARNLFDMGVMSEDTDAGRARERDATFTARRHRRQVLICKQHFFVLRIAFAFAFTKANAKAFS